MRKKMIIGATAGALSLTGMAVAVPALAAPGTTAEAASTAADRIRDALSGLVSDGSISQEQADEVADTLAESGPGGRGGHHGAGRLDLSAAAGALGLSEEQPHTALRPEGTTLADVAEAQGVATDTLLDALVQAEEERIAEAVEQGRITHEQADERLADVEERMAERIERTFPGRGGGKVPRGNAADPGSSTDGTHSTDGTESTEETEQTPAD
ncbi:hypothetical protein ABC795_09855 [Blastococcus sp. HT6-30]|uniref:hypothetical protein n=1 Tax=Blastococcus sp. HT6-30 TaxID=3144843 RepID=UPI003218FEC8